MVTEHWLGPNGLVAAESEFNILDFQNISRAQAGEYMCILTANTNQTASATLTVVVDCELSYSKAKCNMHAVA